MKKVFKMFPYWKGEEEEKWLEQMHRQGWMLSKRFLRFQFIYGQPEKMSYKRDYQPNLKKQEREGYIRLYEESGWEYVTRQADMYYFRMSKYDEEAPELYTDMESKVEQVKKQFNYLLILYVPICLSTISAFLRDFSWYQVLIICAHLVMVLGLWKLWTKRKALEKEVW